MAEHIERFDPSRPLPIITYGLPFEEAIAKHVTATLQRKRPYLLVSGTLSRESDVVERLTARLRRDAGVEVAGVRRGMRSHTLYADLLEVLAELRATGADSIVVVGGGSLVDAAKALAFALANGADSHEKLDQLFSASSKGVGDKTAVSGGDPPKPSTIPYLCATTTLSAGEYSPFGGATNERTHHKQVFLDPNPEAGHRVVALDPRLTLTAPLRVWLSTGMRAVDHCVETVCAPPPLRPEATESALRGIRLLVPALLRTKHNPDDLDARLQTQRGAAQSMKGNVLYGAKLGGSHGIGHQLGPQGVPHAETTCVLLPAVLKYNARVNRDQQAQVLEALWDEPVAAEVLQKQFNLKRETADLGDAIDAVIRGLGLPRTLATYGIGRDRLDAIAAGAVKDWNCQTNPVPLETKEQVLEILEQCLGEA